MKHNQLFFILFFFAMSISGVAQDTINYFANKASSHFQLTATQGKQFTIDWGDGEILTYIGTGEWQFISYTYPVWPPQFEFSVMIAGIDADCRFTKIQISNVFDFDASKASLKYIDLKGRELRFINLSKCAELEELYCSNINGSQLTNLDLSDCTSLRILDVAYCLLSSLDVSNTVLECIVMMYCGFTLSQIYPIYLKVLNPYCSYYHVQNIDQQTIYTGDSVDFSSEKEFGGIPTLFRVFRRVSDGMILAPDSTFSINDGIVTFHKANSYVVEMTSPAMPAWYSPIILAPVVVRQTVQKIINVPSTANVGKPLTLTGTVIPSNAHNKNIIWSIYDAGTTDATISGNKLYTKNTGTVIVTATIKNGSGMDTDYTQNFSIEVESVGINEHESELSKIIIYPNPTTGELRIENVELRIEKIEIFDIEGKIVSSQSFHFLSDHHTIDISHLNSGVYFAKIVTEKGEVVKHVVKQ